MSITVGVYVNVSGHLVHVSRNKFGTAEVNNKRDISKLMSSKHMFTVCLHINRINSTCKHTFYIYIMYMGKKHLQNMLIIYLSFLSTRLIVKPGAFLLFSTLAVYQFTPVDRIQLFQLTLV